MRNLTSIEISGVSGAGIVGAIQFGTTAAWTGAILGGKYGGANGGILGFGIIGNAVGLVAGSIMGAVGGSLIGLCSDDTVASSYSDAAIQFITSGDILGNNNI